MGYGVLGCVVVVDFLLFVFCFFGRLGFKCFGYFGMFWFFVGIVGYCIKVLKLFVCVGVIGGNIFVYVIFGVIIVDDYFVIYNMGCVGDCIEFFVVCCLNVLFDFFGFGIEGD